MSQSRHVTVNTGATIWSLLHVCHIVFTSASSKSLLDCPFAKKRDPRLSSEEFASLVCFCCTEQIVQSCLKADQAVWTRPQTHFLLLFSLHVIRQWKIKKKSLVCWINCHTVQEHRESERYEKKKTNDAEVCVFSISAKNAWVWKFRWQNVLGCIKSFFRWFFPFYSTENLNLTKWTWILFCTWNAAETAVCAFSLFSPWVLLQLLP